MSSESENADDKDFQRMWKIASTAQFVKAFEELFKLPEIEIETLEEGLLNQSMYGIHAVKTLVVALLRVVYPTYGVRLENYESFLQKVVGKIWILESNQEENPLKENTNFENITPLSKLDILYSLCLHLLDKASDSRSKFKDQISKMNSDLLRVQPLGCDNEGNEYWYFYGTRLYKQEPSKDRKIKDWEEEWNTQKNTSFVKRGRGRPKKIKPRKSDGESDESDEVLATKSSCMNIGEKSRWSVVCNTLDDWVEFAEKFKDSKLKCEKALFRTITDNFLPVMNEAYQAKEKKLQQKLRELIPKPTFTRMETRQRRPKSTSDIHGNDDDKEFSVNSREHRLEERNRRLNQSAENGPRRRSRSKISYDENYDDFDDEPSKRPQNRLSYLENDEEDFVKATCKRPRNRLSYVENEEEDLVEAANKSRNQEAAEAKANEILKEYVSVVSNSSSNKSQILRVFTQVKLDKNSYPFHYKIDKEEFPDYYDIISEPMDLGRIERKLRLNIYKTAAEVDDDFKRMVENCELYFGVDSERSKMGRHTWRLFRRLMKELPVPPKQNENSGVANGTGEKGNPNPYKEKRTTNADSERSERGRKKRKCINTEALDILSKEAELAVERSQSMDEEHFRNFNQKTKKFTQFSDLIVEPIHSHPSDLIQKFMSDSSSHENEDGNTDEFSPTDNQNSDSVHQSLPGNMEANDYRESHEENSSSSQYMDKNDPKSFNILSSDNEANLELLNESEMCLSNEFDANTEEKSGDDDLNNSSISSNNLGSSPVSNSFESYHSPNSSSTASSPKDSANYSSQHIGNNTTFFNGYGNVYNFTHENECNGSSTVDASCLGLASSSIYKKNQLENGLKTAVSENFSQASLNCNGNQNSYDCVRKLNSRTQVFSRDQTKMSVSTSDQLVQDQSPQQELSRGRPDQGFQGIPTSLGNLEPSKSPLAFSYSSQQFIQAQIESQSSKPQFQHSALLPEQEVQHKMQDTEYSEKQSRCSPPFLSAKKAQDHGNIESQPNCSPVFGAGQEVDGPEQSRSHQICSSSDSSALLRGSGLPEQEEVNGEGQNFSTQDVETRDSVENHQRSPPAASFSREIQRQLSGTDRARSPTYDMQQEIQNHLLLIQEHNKIQSRHHDLFSVQVIRESEMVKSRNSQASSFPPVALKDQDSAESQQRHLLNSSHDEIQKQRPLKTQGKKVPHPNKQVSAQTRFNSYQEVENGENNRSQPMVSATSSADQQLNDQNSQKNYSMYWDQPFAGSLPGYSPTLSAHQEMNHQQQTINQPRYSPTISAHQEMNHHQQSKNQPRYSPTLPVHQEMNHQQPAKSQPRYSPTLPVHQEMANQPSKNQPRYSPTLSSHQEMNHQQPVTIQPRYSPTIPTHQEINHQQPSKNQPRYSPNLRVHQEMNHQQPAKNQPRLSPNLSAHQEMNHQQPAINKPRYSPTLPVHQEMNNHPSKNQPRYSPNLSAHQEINHHQPAENQPGCPPNASAQPADDKKSTKIQGNSAFLKSQIIEEQESVVGQPSYLSAFSNQGISAQESAKSSVQHMHNEPLSMQNQVPVEAPPFDFGNIFSSSFNSVNAIAQVNEPPLTANSAMQNPPQVSMSHSNQNHMARSGFPTMKVRLPPSTGELIVVPGDPSSMTFHLLAKPLSDPSHPIQSSVQIHANNQMKNQDGQENSKDESSNARRKNPAKQDTTGAPPRKQISPILDLQQLASNPRKSSTSPSSQKNKNCDNISHPSVSAEPSLKSPPAITSDFSVIKPNAVLVRPLESSATSMQQHARNNNSFQQGAFVQQTEGPRTVIFPKGSRMTGVLGSSTNSTSAMSINVNNGQRPFVPNTLPNTVMQNSSGQYVLVPSKDILQSNVDQNLKAKNSERPPQFYPGNMMQSFSFQNGQMNSVQMLPQVNFPYVNPYYIVTNPSAFQNASRYPVMNMQPIPFQNR